MRNRLVLAALAACLALAGCRAKHKETVKVQATEEEAPALASTVHVADPRVASQLISGFYGIEGDSWRWTAGKFAVLLRPPRTAGKTGAVLQLKFALPEPVIGKLKTVSLSATINGTTFPPQAYTQSGEFTYARDVPPNLLGGEAVKVDFALDKALPPSGSDQRELGLVVSAVGFDPK
jgi:hypothetical protein